MTLAENLVRPQYDSHCFSNLPLTVKELLTGQKLSPPLRDLFQAIPQKYETVILFFVDALGWRFIEQFYQHPFLQRMRQRSLNQITSQFPSTTSAHTTCIHTGQPVGESGVFEWQYYEPQLDAIIAPLLFSYAGTIERDTLPHTVKAEDILPTSTFYRELQRHQILSHVFQYRAYTPSTYSNLMFDGAHVHPYRTFPEALVNLKEILLSGRDQATYIFLYLSTIDTVCHAYGPDSPQVAAEVDAFFTIMDALFWRELTGKLDNTLFMLTADHGQIAVNPQTTIYLNHDPAFSGIEKYIRRNRKGELLVPGGSSRDLFLYLNDEMLDEAYHLLANGLAGRADVHLTQDLIDAGLFGPPPLSASFLSRVGNLVILPHQHESVWWYEPGKYEMLFSGHHGGLTPEEVEIPLILYPF